MPSWEIYHQKTKQRPPKKLMLDALVYVDTHHQALDLGAGSMSDSEYLAREFDKVTAIDIEPTAAQNTENPKIDVVIDSFEDTELAPGVFDFINAQYSIPFVNREDFSDTFKKIKESLSERGVICGQFFGVKDEWNQGGKRMTFLTREEVEQALDGLEVIELREEERDAKPVIGDTKHWHLFHFIARKAN